MTRMGICRPASATIRRAKISACSAPTFSTCCRILEQDNLFAELLGQCAISAAGRTDRGALSGQQQRLQPAGASLPLPFGSERRSGRCRVGRWGFVRRVLLRVQCHGGCGQNSPPPGPQGKTALGRHHRRHFEHHSPCREICPLHQYDDGASRSRTAAVRGRTAAARLPLAAAAHGAAGQNVPRGVLHPRSSDPGAPDAIGAGSIFQVQPAVLGNCDPTRAATAHDAHRGRPGRRQRPHAVAEHERRHLVGRRDASGRRSAQLGLVEVRTDYESVRPM